MLCHMQKIFLWSFYGCHPFWHTAHVIIRRCICCPLLLQLGFRFSHGFCHGSQLRLTMSGHTEKCLEASGESPEESRVVGRRLPASPSAPKTRLIISCHTSAEMPTLSCSRCRTFYWRCWQQRSVAACVKQVFTAFIKALSSSEPTIRYPTPNSRPLMLMLSNLHRRWAKNARYVS